MICNCKKYECDNFHDIDNEYEEAEEFEFPDEAMIESWKNGVIYTLAGVDFYENILFSNLILSNGAKMYYMDWNKYKKAKMMPANA